MCSESHSAVLQVCSVIWMMLVSVTPAMRGQCVTLNLWMAAPSAPALLALLVEPATKTWMNVIGKYTEFWMPPSLTDLLSLPIFVFVSESINWLIFLFGCQVPTLVSIWEVCKHGGSFQCQCGRGYTGPRCEIDINECLHALPERRHLPDRIGEFTCICMPGMSVNLILTYSER